MLKGTEVKNIVTATGGVSDYIPGEDLFVSDRKELSVVINADV